MARINRQAINRDSDPRAVYLHNQIAAERITSRSACRRDPQKHTPSALPVRNLSVPEAQLPPRARGAAELAPSSRIPISGGTFRSISHRPGARVGWLRRDEIPEALLKLGAPKAGQTWAHPTHPIFCRCTRNSRKKKKKKKSAL